MFYGYTHNRLYINIPILKTESYLKAEEQIPIILSQLFSTKDRIWIAKGILTFGRVIFKDNNITQFFHRSEFLLNEFKNSDDKIEENVFENLDRLLSGEKLKFYMLKDTGIIDPSDWTEIVLDPNHH